MVLSNRDRVGHGFELLATGLGPYVDRRMTVTSPSGPDWIREFPQTSSITDPYFLFRVMLGRWVEAFASELSRTDRTLVHELQDVRNKWAHNDPFTRDDDAYRALDSIERLLLSVGALDEATEVRRAKRELMHPEEERAPEAPPTRTPTPTAPPTPSPPQPPTPTPLGIDEVWRRIAAYEGETFRQVRGQAFTYALDGTALKPSTVNQNLSQATFEKALERVPLRSTTDVQDLRGPSYLYAILMDSRIRELDW